MACAVLAIVFIVLAIIIENMWRRIKLALNVVKENSSLVKVDRSGWIFIFPFEFPKNISAVCTTWQCEQFPTIPAILEIVTILSTLTVVATIWMYKVPLFQFDQDMLSFIESSNAIVTIWLVCLLLALAQIIMAGVFDTWSWKYKIIKVSSNRLAAAFNTSTIYHTGTIAFGSVFITINHMTRMISDGSWWRICYWLETFVRRFKRNAQILCAIHGQGLCESALDAGQLVVRNVLRHVAVDCVFGIVFGLIRLVLAAGTGFLASLYFWNIDMTEIDPWMVHVPGALLILAAYFFAGMLVSVYSMAVDTKRLCSRE